MNQLKIVEKNNERVLTTTQLAEAYGATGKMISNNFNNNNERFVEGKHYHLLQGYDLRSFLHSYDLGLQNPSKVRSLYLWTERGALRHAKILDTDKAWEVYEQLEDTYFKVKHQLISATNLSPELRMFKTLFNSLASVELSTQEVKQEIQDMREVITLDSNGWRTEGKNLIAKAAIKLGGYEYIKRVNQEVYKALDQRMGTNMKQRLTNMRRRMAEEGVSKSKRDKLNYMDVISRDKKLIEGYVAIVKETAIKYGVA